MNTSLAEQVYTEEIAAGATRRVAGLVAICVVGSPVYRAAWEAGREERLGEGEGQEEGLDYCPCLTGCPECGGVPNHG